VGGAAATGFGGSGAGAVTFTTGFGFVKFIIGAGTVTLITGGAVVVGYAG